MDDPKCNRCPECSCVEFINMNLLGEGYRVCRRCGQEWWVDIDYLIKVSDIEGELRVDSRDIADKLGVTHKNTIDMIRRFQRKLEKYGKVAFESAPLSTENRGTQIITVCYLNERQSTFLVTLSRNSDKAVDLKQNLTDSYHYYKAKQEAKEIKHIPAPPTYIESLRQLADQIEKNQLLETKITEDKPLVEFAKNIESSSESIEVGDLANILCKRGLEIGRNRLFKAMKGPLKMLINAQKPYQHALDNKWLEREEFPFKGVKGEERIAKKVMVTGKGQLYIEKKLRGLQEN